jgi:hypothetical protein
VAPQYDTTSNTLGQAQMLFEILGRMAFRPALKPPGLIEERCFTSAAGPCAGGPDNTGDRQ